MEGSAGVPKEILSAVPGARKTDLGLEVVFAAGGVVVSDGLLVDKNDASKTPDAVITGARHGNLYTLVCIDPDAPSPENPIRAEWLHWVVNNIPAASEGLARASGGHTLVEYMGPAPPMGTHRYIFLAYQQPGDAPMTFEPISQRAHFKVQRWATEHGLGDPLAATFFNSKH